MPAQQHEQREDASGFPREQPPRAPPGARGRFDEVRKAEEREGDSRQDGITPHVPHVMPSPPRRDDHQGGDDDPEVPFQLISADEERVDRAHGAVTVAAGGVLPSQRQRNARCCRGLGGMNMFSKPRAIGRPIKMPTAIAAASSTL